ncbi:hypothetical protein [Methanohalobium sp.]|uniref:hypothetical protein n=1 Tax=Methanohalobium sp. TaxID=2837493 RepID=UPI0025EE2E84|nr:hypothetical protein [Methanohalobium sp.]
MAKTLDPGRALGVVLVVAVIALLLAFMMPVAISSFYSDSSVTFDQTEGETVTLTHDLNATLDNVSDSQNTIDVTVYNDVDSASITALSEGANQTVTVDGNDITVYNDNITSPSNATVTYEYPKTYGWSGGVTTLFGVLPLMILLTAFLFILGYAVSVYHKG